MKDKFNSEFDLQVRSLLQDAAEDVPSGAWDAIESRLQKRRVAALWWKRAGVGLAAAAAVAAALVFSGVLGEAGMDMIQPERIVAQEMMEDTATAPEEVAPEEVVPVEVVRVKVVEVAEQITTKLVASVSEAEPEEIAADRGAGTSSDQPASQRLSTDKDDAGEESAASQLARLLYEDEHDGGRRKVSLAVNGIAGTNDKAKAFKSGSSWFGTSGDKTPVTNIAESSQSRYGVPVSLGVGTKVYFRDRWAVGAGIEYTRLSRNFSGTYTQVGKEGMVERVVKSDDIKHSLNYLGIPVNLFYDILSSDLISLYTFAGATLEKGLGQKYTVRHEASDIVWKQSVSGVQCSAALGLGVQLRITDFMGLYVDPSARYYFDCNQPASIRTQQPFMFSMEVGFRFNL